MTEQVVRGVAGPEISTEVDTEGREVVPKTATVPSKPVNVIWQADGPVRLIEERPKTVTERLNETYRDDELEPQEREFLDLTREHFSRLDDM